MRHLEHVRRGFSAVGIAVVLSSSGWAQLTEIESVAPGGTPANGVSELPAVSPDGRYVAFSSDATNLVVGDGNARRDVFVRDRGTGTIELVSVALAGGPGNNTSGQGLVAISADGRYVAFDSFATNLVSGDSNAHRDVFVRDRTNGTTELVSVSSAAVQGNGDSDFPALSADGRYVAFESRASNLVAGDTNAVIDVFVRDRVSGTTEFVSVSGAGVLGDDESGAPSISADGRYVTFTSSAHFLVAGDANGNWDAFVRDRLAHTTEIASVATGGGLGNGYSGDSWISADGRFVAFDSLATTLVLNDTNNREDVFVHDRTNGTTEIVSVSTGGTLGSETSFFPVISADGRFVEFASAATNLVPGDTNGFIDAFLHDRVSGTTERVSLGNGGVQGTGQLSFRAALSGNGRLAVFSSAAGNLVSGDTNGVLDVFLRDRNVTGFTSLCDPGLAGVVACPCGNPAGGSGRGCDNSSATGGASLSATGIAYLSIDNLVFTTSGEKPTATSILLQGTSTPPAGVVYGQGVRCVGGALKRLFVKAAVAGSITAPDFGIGDPSVSTRSAATGDVIQPGQSRWYLVYYRDPVVLGGCPPSSTFNATQTGRIDWSP
jgi:Tol biopolymer transport system component